MEKYYSRYTYSLRSFPFLSLLALGTALQDIILELFLARHLF